ncbi:MAG: hypothetical protein AAGL89_09730 [Pseudomonadota bacterium]
MTRWFKWLLAGFGGAAILAVAAFAYLAWSTSQIDWNIPVTKVYASEALIDFNDGLWRQADETGCLTADMIRSAANAQEASLTPVAEPPAQCIDPIDLQNWLRVDLSEPQDPYQGEVSDHYGFDAEGCAVPWTYGTC